jgi:hypothetical protein
MPLASLLDPRAAPTAMMAMLQQSTTKDIEQPSITPIRHPWKRLFLTRDSTAFDKLLKGRATTEAAGRNKAEGPAESAAKTLV